MSPRKCIKHKAQTENYTRITQNLNRKKITFSMFSFFFRKGLFLCVSDGISFPFVLGYVHAKNPQR